MFDDFATPVLCEFDKSFAGLVEFVDREGIAIWLILPVVIRSSQRLSHACLSINDFVL
jgi:hypothetical protein